MTFLRRFFAFWQIMVPVYGAPAPVDQTESLMHLKYPC